MSFINKEIEEILLKIEDNRVQQSDIVHLMEIGRQSGFQNINNRKKIWPVLLQINLHQLQESADFLDWRKNPLEHSEDYDQLKKDAMRSFYSLDIYKDIDRHYLQKKQEDLLEILDAFAKNQPKYRYFQGFHDIVSIFIGLFGSNIGYYMSHKMATTFLRDSFLFSFQETIAVLDRLIYFILVKTDPQYEEILEDFEDHKLGFTMPWIITWFSHSFQDINMITRIWDYLISSQASAIVYLSAALILDTKKELIAFCTTPDTAFDIGSIHSFYQNIQKVPINIQKVICTARQLEQAINFEQISETKTLPEKTVMKDTNFIKLIGAHEVYKQTKIRRERTKKYMRTVLMVGGIVAIGVLTYSFFGKKPPIKLVDTVKGL